ncbi:MAG: DNA-binding domain-containing protein [Vicinamibacterales bacterium]|jgi:hypothetical protein
MPPLAEVQRRVRNAIIAGDAGSMASLIDAGPRDATRRMAIHLRHYRASLVAILMGRFPATTWLLGSGPVEAAAAKFVGVVPPSAPCLAEYGAAFPAFLGAQPVVDRITYVEPFADLEWHFGRLSVSVDGSALGAATLAALDADDLADTALVLQGGTHYWHAAWPIDELLAIFLRNAAPEQTTLREQAVWIEGRGRRGEVQLNQLTEGDWTFRDAIWRGRPIGVAAERAWQVDPRFDPGVALAAMFSQALVIGAVTRVEGTES